MVREAGLVSPQAVRLRPAVRVELAPDLMAPGRARRALERLNHGVGPDTIERLKLLVSELVTNSVVHAGLSDRDRIAVAVAMAPNSVRVEVCDNGPGFDLPPAPDIDDVRGRGLLLVEAVSDRWGVTRGEPTRVWFEIDSG
ncbi:MAG: ATP-binding protein [Thermoleophilaceae bacterium]